MAAAVVEMSERTAPGELPEQYSDAPDGVRVNMILSLDGAAAFHGLAGPAAVERLQVRGFRRVLCEGGPTLLDELIAADLVDEMCLTLSPTLCAAEPVARPGVPLTAPGRLSLQHAFVIDDYVYVRYRRRNGDGKEPM